MKLSISMYAITMLGLSISASTVLAQDGAALFVEKSCIACHGPEGKKPITNVIPKLAGQNSGYLVQQITDIKSGARANGGTAQMKGIVANVSEVEIEAIATYLSSL